MGTIDLDAARAARAEKNSEPKTLRFGDQEFELPAELPVDVGESWRAGDWRGGLVALLDSRAEEFLAIGPSIEDLKTLDEKLAELYGFTSLGESSSPAESAEPAPPGGSASVGGDNT